MITPYKPPELVNNRVNVQLVYYDVNCLFCRTRMSDVTFHYQVPKFCRKTHGKKYQTLSETEREARKRIPTPKAVKREAQCRRCGCLFSTTNPLPTVVCSVLCLLKANSPDRYSKCWRKVAHITRARAVEEAWRMGNETGDHGLQPYQCVEVAEGISGCGFWHIGHPGTHQFKRKERDES